MISDVTLLSMQRRVDEALKQDATVIVFEMDTYGGLVTSALEICSYIKSLDVRTVAWVNNKAYSAGAMISLACDEIVMRDPSRIGDCAPIAMGQKLEGVERAKVESPILEEFRDSAKRNNYPESLCEAMVRLKPAIYKIERTDSKDKGEIRYVFDSELDAYTVENEAELTTGPKTGDNTSRAITRLSLIEPQTRLLQPGTQAQIIPLPNQGKEEPKVSKPTKVPSINSPTQRHREPGKWRIIEKIHEKETLLTMNAARALELGFSKKTISSDEELAAYTDAADGEINRMSRSWSEDIAQWLVSPAIRSILMILLMMGAYMELKAPGVGLPGAIALGALVLLVGAPYFAGMASMMEILIMLGGIVLIGVEVFVIPGFGLAGITGIAMFFVGLLMTFFEAGGPGFLPDTDFAWEQLQEGLVSVVIAMIAGGAGIFILTKYFGVLPVFKRLVLADGTSSSQIMASASGTSIDSSTSLQVGDIGIVTARLTPSGEANFDDRIVDVKSNASFIDAGTKIRVVSISGNLVTVEEE